MRTVWLLAACTIISAMACHHAAPSKQRGISSIEAPQSTVRVENKHWLDVDIYVEHEGQRQRLGTVTATSTASFTLRPAMISGLGDIELIADAIGSPASATTGRITVKPGMHVDWTLQIDLSRSSVAVY
ncbi:MAG TPA: hypothetical protein VF166_14330 [Gemmatimonadaceae bacterium]